MIFTLRSFVVSELFLDGRCACWVIYLDQHPQCYQVLFPKVKRGGPVGTPFLVTQSAF